MRSTTSRSRQWHPAIRLRTILGTVQEMKCVICKKGETVEGKATVTLERGRTTLVIRSVPAQVCRNCGEEYVEEGTMARLLETVDEAARAGVLVDVRDYVAA